ncbi:MAG: threonine synthase, partial [Desulfobulbaceae bacterium]|nr:threonine synthase [Desulfobulbaceae bacterium]
MEYNYTLKCLICGQHYHPDEVDYVCPDHGDEGILDVEYDYVAIRETISRRTLAESIDMTIWRYKPLLPVAEDAIVPPLALGWTPLYQSDRLAATLGLKNLWVKDDGRQPTDS